MKFDSEEKSFEIVDGQTATDNRACLYYKLRLRSKCFGKNTVVRTFPGLINFICIPVMVIVMFYLYCM